MKWWSIILIVLGGAHVTAACGEEPAKKAAAPDDAAQKELKELVTTIYKTDFAFAKTPEQRVALARKLLRDGLAITDDPKAKFVMLRLAREITSEHGELELALQAAQATGVAYDVDALQLKADTAAAACKMIRSPKSSAAVPLVIQLADEAVAADRFAIGRAAVDLALRLARMDRKSTQVSVLVAKGKEIAILEEEFTKLKEANSILESNPTDPVANLTVGRYQAIVKGDWETGVPLLALGNDENLKTLAVKELADKPKAIEIADGWWTESETYEGATQASIQYHAVEWYRRALPDLTGLHRTKALSRMTVHYGPAPISPRPNGLVEKSLDCSRTFHERAMGSAFEINKSWSLSLDAQIPSFDQGPYLLVIWGDDRSGFDPIFIRLDENKLLICLDDCRTNIRQWTGVDLGDEHLKHWTKIAFVYRADDGVIQLYVNDTIAADVKCDFEPNVDRKMPVRIGGGTRDSQRFRGAIRDLAIGNVP